MNHGFTLVELLLVFIIIGVLTTLGVNDFKNFSESQALQASDRAVKADLFSARELAIAGNKPSGCTAPNLLTGFRFNVNSNTSYRIDAVCTNNIVITIKGPVTIATGTTISTPNPNPILFKPLAQGTNIATGATSTITITQISTGHTLSITIGANGDIQ